VRQINLPNASKIQRSNSFDGSVHVELKLPLVDACQGLVTDLDKLSHHTEEYKKEIGLELG